MRDTLIKRWHALKGELGEVDVALLAVSKYAPDEAVQVLIDAGQTCFGESRPQQLRDRAVHWPACAWHMIGPVQKNKAKYIGRHASMWHSCDDLQVAQTVARHVGDRRLPVLIQVNVAEVAHQRGVQVADVPAFAAELVQVEGLQLAGLMCMAAKGGDAEADFRILSGLRDRLLDESVAGMTSLELCMGMSGDYQRAIAAGSNMVRLGSLLFGDWDVRKERQGSI